jgi:hypothetical protein
MGPAAFGSTGVALPVPAEEPELDELPVPPAVPVDDEPPVAPVMPEVDEPPVAPPPVEAGELLPGGPELPPMAPVPHAARAAATSVSPRD